MKVDAATKLIWSNCYDIGTVFAYASPAKFKAIETCIRRVLKSAGLDYLMDTRLLYLASLKLTPLLMAKKQIVQLGIKFLDSNKVKENRYLVRIQLYDDLKPFWRTFLKEFNGLPLATRKYIIDNLDVLDKAKMGKIKDHLKTFYRKQFNPTEIDKEERRQILSSNLYSKATVLKRKREAEQRKYVLNNSTPTGQRFRSNSIENMRPLKKCFAPERASFPNFCPNNETTRTETPEPPRKCIRIDEVEFNSRSMDTSTPCKRKRGSENGNDKSKKRRIQDNPVADLIKDTLSYIESSQTLPDDSKSLPGRPHKGRRLIATDQSTKSKVRSDTLKAIKGEVFHGKIIPALYRFKNNLNGVSQINRLRAGDVQLVMLHKAFKGASGLVRREAHDSYTPPPSKRNKASGSAPSHVNIDTMGIGPTGVEGPNTTISDIHDVQNWLRENLDILSRQFPNVKGVVIVSETGNSNFYDVTAQFGKILVESKNSIKFFGHIDAHAPNNAFFLYLKDGQVTTQVGVEYNSRSNYAFSMGRLNDPVPKEVFHDVLMLAANKMRDHTANGSSM